MDTLSLNGTWRVAGIAIGFGRQKGWDQLSRPGGCSVLESFIKESIPASVPGDVHLDLLNAGLIDEPLFDRNAQNCAWVIEREWWYRREFTLDKISGIHSELFFSGLDTDAEVWLNGHYLGQHQNMFIPKAFDVTNVLRPGKNVLVVKLDAGVEKCKNKPLAPYKRITKDDDDTRRVWVRKAQFSFGWDWAPRLLTCGIWRDVQLRTWETSAIRWVKLDSHIDGRDAELIADVEIEWFADSSGSATLSLQCERDEQRSTTEIPVILEPGFNRKQVSLKVEDVALWWPASHGEPNLYDVSVELKADDKILDRYKSRYGFRTVELVEEDRHDGMGKTFYFKVNGIRVFCKGANWVPADSIPARVTGKRLKTLLKQAVEANFNMLRVWGGGYYETGHFYELCDELGIMLWHDFMFACGYYPDDDPAFCREVERETEVIVKELRNHPSLVLWCGNNENDWIYFRERAVKPDLVYHGKRINNKILPEVLSRLDPSRPYIPSSPFGNESDPNAATSGDQHNWEVTLLGNDVAERADFHKYANHCGSFVSEFGLLCPPNLKSVQDMLPPDQQYVDSNGWKFHNNTLERGVQLAALKRFWGRTSAPLADYIKMLQAYHAEGLKFAFEHYRRRMFDCGGALFWQYNDSWGAIGWSIIDYYLRKKPSYYTVRRALESPLLSLKNAGNEIEVWLIHDGLASVEGKVIVRWMTFTGQDEILDKKTACIEGPGSSLITRIRLDPIRHIATNGLVLAEFYSNGQLVTWNRSFLEFPGRLPLKQPKIRIKGDKEPGGWRLQLVSDTYAWMVWIDVADDEWVSDNAFDLWPSHVKEVVYRGNAKDPKSLHITCLNSLCQSVERNGV